MDTLNRTPQDMQPAANRPQSGADTARTDTGRWLLLAERFFEADTTETEERELRRFLRTPESQDPRFDELRAYMAFAATGRAATATAKPATRKKTRRLRPAVRRAAAAALAAAMLIPAALRLVPSTHEVCVAYVGGERITERDAVLDNIHGIMENVMSPDQDYSMEQQLGDMFTTLEEGSACSEPQEPNNTTP